MRSHPPPQSSAPSAREIQPQGGMSNSGEPGPIIREHRRGLGSRQSMIVFLAKTTNNPNCPGINRAEPHLRTYRFRQRQFELHVNRFRSLKGLEQRRAEIEIFKTKLETRV